MLNNNINIGSTPIRDLNNVINYNRTMTSVIPSVDRNNETIMEVNIKDEKAREKEKMLDLINKRQQEILESSKVKKTPMEESIEKLKNILSKRFNLEEDDYRILVDRYHIAKNGITKSNLEEMISYIKQTSQYSPNRIVTENALKLKDTQILEIDKLEEERRLQLEQMRKKMDERKNTMQEPIVNKPLELVINRPTEITREAEFISPIITKVYSNPILCILGMGHIVANKDGVYEIPLWIDDLDKLKHKKKCKLLSCEIEKPVYETYMANLPYILINIEECENHIYINGTTKKLTERLRFIQANSIYYGEGSRELSIISGPLKKISISFHDSKGQPILLEKANITISIEIF